MHNIGMELRQLRTLLRIAETGGVARAAARLHLSQPAASRQIQALENELGVRLFERARGGMRMTSAGKELLRHGRTILTSVDALYERARELRGGTSGLLRLGSTPQAIEYVLAPFLKTYRAKHPGVDVQLLEDGGARLASRLERAEVDLALMPVGDGQFGGIPLYPMHLLAFMPKRPGWHGRAMLDVTELAGERLMVGAGFASRVWFDAACQLANITPNIVFESGAPHTLLAAVKANLGIAILPSVVAIRMDEVSCTPIVYRGESVGRWAMIAWNTNRVRPLYVTHFAQELAHRYAKTYPGRALLRRAPPLPKPRILNDR